MAVRGRASCLGGIAMTPAASRERSELSGFAAIALELRIDASRARSMLRVRVDRLHLPRLSARAGRGPAWAEEGRKGEEEG